MTRERSIDLAIMFLNLVAVVVLVGILSVMVNTAEAREPADQTITGSESNLSDSVTASL
ncbi:MAG: hypothetical protein R3F50_15075 [Gammaproteobacteria bacterium]|jgi:hypothetical protein